MEVARKELAQTRQDLEAVCQKKLTLSPMEQGRVETAIANVILRSVQDIIWVETLVEEILAMDRKPSPSLARRSPVHPRDPGQRVKTND